MSLIDAVKENLSFVLICAAVTAGIFLLAWAAEKGLVSGEGFAPAAPCTRAEIVSLLYRAAN